MAARRAKPIHRLPRGYDTRICNPTSLFQFPATIACLALADSNVGAQGTRSHIYLYIIYIPGIYFVLITPEIRRNVMSG